MIVFLKLEQNDNCHWKRGTIGWNGSDVVGAAFALIDSQRKPGRIRWPLKNLFNQEQLLTFVVAFYESLVGGCLSRARPQLTWSRRPLDQVDLRLALFPQASPPNAHRGSNEALLKE
ncbi:hypothetical protein HLI_16170 [Halobacillus litoralis]|uniref:Uncharacterized protein n=1 Tax=Halobacillus litoralis TaxID=45668 RepID=A0A410MFZ4_9BACI|nr:hypothetical protein HLI_16170 [Halobacillus litoralis]